MVDRSRHNGVLLLPAGPLFVIYSSLLILPGGPLLLLVRSARVKQEEVAAVAIIFIYPTER